MSTDILIKDINSKDGPFYKQELQKTIQNLKLNI